MQNHGKFTLTNTAEIKELKATLYDYTHACGARAVHIATDDPENVFCIAFQTIPESNNGVAHILEHVALCGSENYPVRDPFFSMTRRSMNTYMNALTGADSTYYPGASQIKQDYFNIFGVYIDAAFRPLLRDESFWQEGWRYALTNEKDVNSPVKYDGIVYNEMKGAYASRDARLWQEMCHALYPDITYKYSSGGDPVDIPSLTNAELRAFHKKHYAPGRAIFVTYGNIPLKENLDFIEEHALKEAKTVEPLPEIPPQKRFTKPVEKKVTYPAKQKGSKTIVTHSWLTVDSADRDSALVLQILDSYLNDTYASPMQKALIGSGLCSQVEAFLDTEMSEIPYVIICRGCEEGSAKEIEKVIFSTLEKLAEKGITLQEIDSSLHNLEISRMEITRGGGPFGLSLAMRAAAAIIHGAAPETSLEVYSRLEYLRGKFKDPGFLSDFIKKHLLSNTHRALIEMNPSAEQSRQEKEAEEKFLQELSKKLTKQEREEIAETNKRLKEYQEAQENLDSLPEIQTNQIPEKALNLSLIHHETRGHLAPYYHKAFTNHLVYAQMISDLPDLKEEEFLAAELLINILPDLGAGKRTSEENAHFIHQHTGGINSYVSVQSVYGSHGAVRPVVSIGGRCLSRNKHHLFQIMRDFYTNPRFDEKGKLKQLIEEMATSMKANFNDNALMYAKVKALSSFSTCNYLHELMHGTRFYTYIMDLADNIDMRLPLLIQQFESLQETLFHGHNIDLLITADDEDYKEIRSNGYYGADAIQQKAFHPFNADFVLPKNGSQAVAIASNVAFTAKAIPLHGAPNLDAAPLHLAAKIMTHKVLHRKIREQGGAYGAGATFSPLTGNFIFHAYRDPNISATLQAFEEAIHMLTEEDFDKEDIKNAKLSLLQQFDDPLSPGQRGITAYNWMHTERTWEERQRYRKQIMQTSRSCIRNAAEKSFSNFNEKAATAIFAGKELLEKENVDLEIISL